MESTIKPLPAEGGLSYKNICFDDLEIKWKAKPAKSTEHFSALSGWLPDDSKEIPLGKSKVTWAQHEAIGPVKMKLEGAFVTLPKGYVYKLRSDLGIFKPVSDEKNVFYDVTSQWVIPIADGQGDKKIGSTGHNSCAGTGSQEVRNRTALPAVAYVQAHEDITVSLEVEYADQALHLASGSQMHIEVVGTTSEVEGATETKSPEAKKTGFHAPWHRAPQA